MPITEMELQEALTKASSLMTKEGQRRIDNAAKKNSENFDGDGGFMQPSESYNMRKTMVENRNFKPNPHSSLPKAIQESISKNPMDCYAPEQSSSDYSILDSINYVPKVNTQRQTLQETMVHDTYTNAAPQYYAPPQQQYVSQPQFTIDYNYIRAIVNECVQANLKQIKEELLNESSLKVVRLGGENKIQLIDNKNNLYESKLEYKRNLNKK